MKRFFALALMVLFIGICPNPSSADQADVDMSATILMRKEDVRKNPNDWFAHFMLGHAYALSERYPEAIAEYKEAIRINPNQINVRANLGNTYALSGRYPEAISEYKEAIRINPNDSDTHSSLGHAYALSERYPEAIAEYKEAIRINPNDIYMHILLGNTYLDSKRYPEAIAEYKEILRIAPYKTGVHFNLGHAYALSERYPEAIAEYKEAIRSNPKNADAHFNLGLAYNKVENGSGAIIEMSLAEKLYEKNGDQKDLADSKRNLRLLYSRYGYKPEDFAAVQVPENKPPRENRPAVPAPALAQPTRPAPTPITPKRVVSLGTGVLFGQSMQVFTSHHVVRGANHIKIIFVNGETILAGISYVDEANDIAMLSLAQQPKIQLRRIALADVSKSRPGEKVFTIGYPVSDILGREPRYSEGAINSLKGMSDDARLFQISVPIQPGNSGGPLFNEKGEVIGMITSTFSTNEASLLTSGAVPQNVNFAVKSSLFAGKALTQTKGVNQSSIVPVPVPFSIPDFVAGIKNNIVLIEAGE